MFSCHQRLPIIAAHTRNDVPRFPGYHDHKTCTDFCNTLYDCYFASLDWQGRCKFFQECKRSDWVSKSEGYIYARTTVPTTPEPSPTEGYTLEGTGKVCNTATARAASRSALGGGGNPLALCAQSCDAQRDCFFFFWTSTGYCKMFAECPDLVTHSLADTQT